MGMSEDRKSKDLELVLSEAKKVLSVARHEKPGYEHTAGELNALRELARDLLVHLPDNAALEIIREVSKQ